MWYPWLGRRRARAAEADVYHCPTLRAPLTRGKPPLVVTVHDLVPVLFPETMSTWSGLYTRATLRSVIKSADIIVAVSQTTANDLNRLLHISPDRIRVVWSGVDEIFLRQEGTAPLPIPTPYVLFVGTPEPRKNLPRLVEAMKVLRKHGLEQRLVIAGGGGWGKVALDSRDVHVLGRVSDAELASLYTHASCLALPSLYEGFGLTAVEAMAVGTPVVASSAGSLPEITGSAAVLVDPYDVGAIAAGLERAIRERDSLIIRGQERATQFRWERTAGMMTEVYKEVE